MPTTIIEDVLAQWLAALPAVVAQANGQVYPYGEVAQGTTWPFLTYFRVSGPRVRSLRGPVGVSYPTIQIGAHARVYSQAKQLADAVRIALDDFAPGYLGALYVQSIVAGDDRDYGPTNDELNPPFGGEDAQPCVSFDVTIWFNEGS